MNASSSRRIVAQTVIISAIAAGLWHFGVGPMAAAAARAEATLRIERGELAGAQRAVGQDDPSARLAGARSGLERLEMLSARASSGAELYDRISEFAARAGVRVQRIDPKGVAQPLRDAARRTPRAVTGTLCTIEVSGGFDRIAAFARALQDETGLSRIASIRLAPARSSDDLASEPTLLSATLELAQFRIATELEAASKGHGARGAMK